MDFQDELKLRAIHDLHQSVRSASLRVEQFVFRYGTVLTAIAFGSLSVPLRGMGVRIGITVNALALCFVACLSVILATKHQNKLLSALCDLQRKLGYFSNDGFGLDGPALPSGFDNAQTRPKHKYIRLHLAFLCVVGAIAVSAPWLTISAARTSASPSQTSQSGKHSVP